MSADQDTAAERAIEYLAREIRKICPPSLLADPTRWAADRIAAMRAEHWRCLPPPPDPVRQARQPADPPNAEYARARAALERIDQQ